MSGSSLSFVSTAQIDAARAQRDADRQVVLEERRTEYEERMRREARIAKRKAETGEDVWMAPGLERRIGGAGSPPQSASSKRHHKHHKKRSKSDKADRDDAGDRDLEREAKKKKHHKKHKKHKKSSRHDKGASSGKHAAAPGESSSDSDQWVVKGEDGPTPAELQAKRDASEAAREDWMVPAALRQAEAAADPAELRSLRAADPFAALTGGEDHRRSKAAERAREKERKEREAAKEQGSARELNPYFADGGKGLPPDRDVERAKKLGGWRARALKRAGADIAVSEGDGASSSSSRSAGQDGGEPRSVSDDRGETRPAMIRPSADASGWRRRLREAVSASETGVGDEATTGAGDAPGHPGDSWAPSPAAAHVDHGAAEGAGGSPPPSDTMINDLAAAHMRAQLMGDDAEAARINIQLERAKSRKAGGGGGSHGGGRGPSSSERSRGEAPQEHVLMHTRKDGFAMPARGVAKVRRDRDRTGRPRRQKLGMAETHEGGERTIYFAEDSKGQNIQEMLEEERMGVGEDFDERYMRLAAKDSHKTNDDYTIDDMFVDRAARTGAKGQRESRDRDRAINQNLKHSRTLESCRRCFDGSKFEKHLLVALGAKMYMALPARGSLTKHHCIIVPMRHVAGSLQLDENEWDEMKMFQRCLVDMFDSMGMDVVFMETVMDLRRHPHSVIHCVPVSRDEGAMMPMYFKKAIQECDTQWSQHKKLIDTRAKDVRRSIPKGFPYFHVTFGNDGGFGHVVEDEQVFPGYFGLEVVGGCLDVNPNLWLNPPRENFPAQKHKVLEFGKVWKDFDWTEQLDME